MSMSIQMIKNIALSAASIDCWSYIIDNPLKKILYLLSLFRFCLVCQSFRRDNLFISLIIRVTAFKGFLFFILKQQHQKVFQKKEILSNFFAP